MELAITGERPPDGIRPLLLGAEWFSTQAGGLNRYLAELVSALARAGARPQVVVVGPTPSSPILHGTSEPDAPLLARVVAVRRAAIQLGRRTDVVDAHFALYALLPISAAVLRGIPLVVHFQGPWADESRVGQNQGWLVACAKRAVERAVYRQADHVIVLSRAFGRLVVERYGVDPDRVEVVPPGVDLDRFRPGDRLSARARFGLDPAAFVAVSVRRLDFRMGLDVLVDAWAIVQEEQSDAFLLIAGEGRERTDLEQRCARLPRPEQVRFLGFVTDEELVALYQAADCSVVPTRALEGFGLVTLESAACGTAAVVTDTGGLPDGVIELDATLVVPAGDPRSLARRLLAAARGDLPNRAATRVHAERFSWDVVARRHIDLYEVARGRLPLRVTYLGHTAELSGGELALARLLPALSGVESRVVLAQDGPLVARLRGDGFGVEVVPMGEVARSLRRAEVGSGGPPMAAIGHTILGIWRVVHHLRTHRPDLVHTNTLKAALYGGMAGRLVGVPVVWHVRDRIAPDYLPRPAVRLVGLAARVLPSAIIANSQATLDTIRPWRAGHRIYDVVLANPNLGAHRTGPGSGDRPFTVGMVGRLAPWKGQDVFLRAFAQSFPDGEARARVVGGALFGEDDWAATLCVLAKELGIIERVDFIGFTTDVASEYARLDVFVHASVIPEPFGQVVFEAMAAGLAVIAPDAGGPGEIITDGVDGLLYPMADVEALATLMRRLASDRALRSELGEAGSRRIAEFASTEVAAKVMAVYDEVLVGRRRARRRSWGFLIAPRSRRRRHSPTVVATSGKLPEDGVEGDS